MPKSGATPVVVVDRNSIGLPVLKITYSWTRHSRPSIQMTLLTDAQGNIESLQPLPFRGEAALDLWSSQVKRLHQPIFPSSAVTVGTTSALLEYDDGKRLLTVRGSDNALKKPSAYGYDEKDGSRVVFYMLDNWSDVRGNFQVDLSDLDLLPKYHEAGRLRVWLLDQEKVVWSQTVAWPGKQPVTPSKKSPANDQVPLSPNRVVDQPKTGPAISSPLVPKSDVPPSVPPVVDVRPSSPPEKAPPLKPRDVEPVRSPAPLSPPADLSPPTIPSPSATPRNPALSPTNSAPSMPPAVISPARPVPLSPPDRPASSPVATGPSPSLTPPASTPVTSSPGGKSLPPPASGTPNAPMPTSGSPTSIKMEDMNIDELADNIEQRWGESMSKDVRRAWLGGWHYYCRATNPEPVRRTVFMSLLITCFKGQPAGELRDAFALLYWKLKKLGG